MGCGTQPSGAGRAGYAAARAALVTPGGALLIVAHDASCDPGDARDPVGHGTYPVSVDELRARLPGFALTRSIPTVLAGAPAQLHELTRRT